MNLDPATGTVKFVHGDPLAASVDYRWDEPVTHKAIPFAADESGATVFVGLYEANILLGGVPGSGKSGGATALLAGIGRLPDVALVGLDPKRLELHTWKDRFSMIAKENEHASAVLDALLEEMERRYVWMESESDRLDEAVKKLPLDRLNEMPLIVVLIDELAELVSVGATKDEKAAEAQRSTAIRRLVAKGRAAGIVVITATQKPSSDVIPTSLRDLIQQRVGYMTTTPDMTDTILGAGATSNGALSHEIAKSQGGVAYILNEGSRVPARVRTFWIPDAEVAGIARSTAGLRVELPFLPTAEEAAAAAAEAAMGEYRAAPTRRSAKPPVAAPVAGPSAPEPAQSARPWITR
jgi:DNA segregation ATPase FtsK/SpoIIIE-like protein